MTTLKEMYEKEIVPGLKETFGYKNPMEVPKLDKIVLNIGLGEAINNVKLLDSAVEDLALIAGQRPVITKAKKSIAAFKLREGMPIGCMVTLRREKMYDFLLKLINITLPRVRDFRGISGKAFDGHGNYSLGIKEHIIFPEIDFDQTDSIKGLNVSIVTTAKTDKEGKELLKQFGMPFKN
ncbi:RplE [Desulforapulum autotrophicum HRM2]|uniref:Large ribosomal subunit protein uL5 n=1 Tax=Desulforapulum autotrophicum (strain ATCC 43914 / DSM 3382 / VKM B-1955 / HRM2) TaxID=177437 RepID=RL5_DESAH|nr:50S ribosomal protein L5 [Desulforapulum autotrophicum]C0Q9W1.1 RecName: Full=Large ribosomal subunit protein uL5; AltName: Full=50S ribosomal protein L5 [Desulforapulum autotrophicum HRM2]ACN16679.1 RplE [Desulforapulum autotrophicum HRM2]